VINKEDQTMSLSRKGLLLKGSLMTYLQPKLAADAKLDLDSLLDGVTEENFSEEKRDLIERIRAALRGKLSAGASVSDLHQLLNAWRECPRRRMRPLTLSRWPSGCRLKTSRSAVRRATLR
jgi:hypothetical protein